MTPFPVATVQEVTPTAFPLLLLPLLLLLHLVTSLLVLCLYRQLISCFCLSEFCLCLCCCLAVTAAVLSLLLLFFSVTSSASITRSRQEKTTQEANFCNGRRVVSQPVYQVTKFFAHITREWVFALIIANLAFRWRFVLHQLQHCLFSTCHSSPTKKNAPSSAFVGNGFGVIWSSLRIVIAKGLIQTEIALAKCAPSGARAISCNLIQFFFSSKYPWSVENSLCSFKSSLILWAFSSSQGNKETSIIGSLPYPLIYLFIYSKVSIRDAYNKIFLKINFYMCGCFAYMYVCDLHVCLMPAHARRDFGSLGIRVADYFKLPYGC